MKVRDVMHRGVNCADPDTPVRQVAEMMRDADVGAIPVREGGRLVGIITDRDITCRAVADGRDVDSLKAREVMTTGALCCSEDDDIDDAIELMERKKIRRLPVIDAQSQPVGMVSLGDISSRADEDDSGELLRAVSAHHA